MWFLTVATFRCQVDPRQKLFTIAVLFRGVWAWNLKIFKATSHENSEGDGNAEDSVLDEATEDYWAGSGSGPEDDDSIHNETREALTHEASDHDAVSTLAKRKCGSRRVGSILRIFHLRRTMSLLFHNLSFRPFKSISNLLRVQFQEISRTEHRSCSWSHFS